MEPKRNDQKERMFAFKCNVNEKLTIGVCEYCSSKNVLRTICKCKNVKYCNDDRDVNKKRYILKSKNYRSDGPADTGAK